MGYRSNIRIRTTKEGFEKMKEFVNKYLQENLTDEEKQSDYSYNLLEKGNFENIEETDVSVTIDWVHLKWYEGYKDVGAIMKSLDYLVEQDIDFQYARIGEDYDDIEEYYHVDYGSFDDFYISRTFEN